MKFGPLEISLRKDRESLSPVDSGRGGWLPIVREWAPGFWQRDIEVSQDTALSFHAFYACVTCIAADIGKLRLRLVSLTDDGIWQEVESAAFSPVLRKPNGYQNHIQFKEWWTTSKLIRGNTYALKERDNRGVVVALHVLDPTRVRPAVATSGDVFYQLSHDDLSGVPRDVTVPASEVIHDRMNCLFHPLVGIPPLYACGIAAGQGLAILKDSNKFFDNSARPSGVLTAPAGISDETAARLKDSWASGFTGDKAGRVAVLGDGLKFEPLRMTAVEAQLIEQLKYSADIVCSAFGIPPHVVSIGPAPSYNNVGALQQQYYSQCLQKHIESFELCMDEGLGIGVGVKVGGAVYGTELDIDGLLRMDMPTAIRAFSEGVKGSVFKPNEARKRLNLPPVTGGDAVFMQQQDFSLEALAERDAAKPFVKPDAPAASATEGLSVDAAVARSVVERIERSMPQRAEFDQLRRETEEREATQRAGLAAMLDDAMTRAVQAAARPKPERTESDAEDFARLLIDKFATEMPA